MALFWSENTCIDRISVLNCQLVAYPNKLSFGQCYQFNDFHNLLPLDSSFTVLNSELEEFLSLLHETSIESEKTIELEYTDCKVTITPANSVILVCPNGQDYVLQTKDEVKIFVNAVIDLALLTYCYTGIINHYLSKFLNTSQLSDYNNLSDQQVFQLFDNIKVTIDYYMFLRVVQRHKKILHLLKKLQLSVLTDTTTPEPIMEIEI